MSRNIWNIRATHEYQSFLYPWAETRSLTLLVNKRGRNGLLYYGRTHVLKDLHVFTYTFQQTETIVVPGSIHCLIKLCREEGGGGGTPKSFIRKSFMRGSAARSNFLPSYIPFFQKSHPFEWLLLEKGTPFIYLLNSRPFLVTEQRFPTLSYT